MKRKGNLFNDIISIENLKMADLIARKGKMDQRSVQEHLKNEEANIIALHEALKNKTYKTSPYYTFLIYEPKERLIFRLPYYPDRIVHHAIMLILEPIFVAMFTADTYSCIKGRGVHGCLNNLTSALKNYSRTECFLKIDIQKFYPSVNHVILKKMLRRKFKDPDLLWLLDEIIDSAEGLPIGNYLSQFLANFYLTPFDHWIKEVLGVKDYFRYADDIVILHWSSRVLHDLRVKISNYLEENVKLKLKSNWQVAPVWARGIDYVGYKSYHTKILLRKSIKQRYARMLKRSPNLKSIASYNGWLSHCDSLHLQKKLLSHDTVSKDICSS